MSTEIRWGRIDKVCARIVRHPNEFYMGKWLGRALSDGNHTSEPTLAFLHTGIVPKMSCGMTACFGGETILLFPQEAKQLLDQINGQIDEMEAPMLGSEKLTKICCAILGIPEKVGDKLFHRACWPAPYHRMDDVAGILAIVKHAKSKESFDFMLRGDQDDV
jgi:hypothetical protein